jgi:hypothetical protein
MNIRLHQLAERSINHLVTPQAIRTGKFLGDNSNVKVPQATPGACMACMQMALILNQQLYRRKFVNQCFLNALYSVIHGNTSLNGLTMTF